MSRTLWTSLAHYFRHSLKTEDERREKVLSELGLRVVRFGNDEVMRGLSAVVGKIKEAILL